MSAGLRTPRSRLGRPWIVAAATVPLAQLAKSDTRFEVCILLQAPVIPSVTMFGQELEIEYAGLYPASQDVCDLKLWIMT